MLKLLTEKCLAPSKAGAPNPQNQFSIEVLISEPTKIQFQSVKNL